MNLSGRDILCESYIKMIYQNIKTTFSASLVSETYGEILPNAIDKLLSNVTLTHNDIFFDLGSGLGKLAIQVFMKSCAKEVCGVEISPQLHQQALAVSERILFDLPGFYSGDRKLTFLLGSFLDLSISHASMILISSPCFSPSIMQALTQLIEHSSGIHTVLSMRPMHGLTRLSFKKSIRIDCSWDTALCYLYAK